MATSHASIRKARASQTDLKERREHCSASPSLLQAVGIVVGQQVRVVRSSTEYALYTVSETQSENPDDVVRMGLTGRQRLRAPDEFDAALDPRVVDPTTDDADAQARGEFVERLDDDGHHRGLVVIAPHGGDIEAHTDTQAERVASLLSGEGVSSWRCKGWKPGDGALERWHITSSDIHPASFGLLASISSRGFTHAVAFHGFTSTDGTDVLIGGGAPRALKRAVRRNVADALAGTGLRVRLSRPEDRFGGDDPGNIVNRLTANRRNGIQIEQSLRARTDHGEKIAGAIADTYRDRLPTAPQRR